MIDQKLFIIEEKEAKINLMKTNTYFESATDMLLFEEKADENQIIKTIKKFFDDLIETIKDTARKIELRIASQINQIHFNKTLTNLKKLVSNTNFKSANAAGTIDVLDIRKIEERYNKCIDDCIKSIKLLKKCKTMNELNSVTDRIDGNIDKLEEFTNVSLLDKYMIKMDVLKYINLLESKTFEKSSVTVSTNMIKDLKTLKSDYSSAELKSGFRTAINDIGGEKITSNEVIKSVQKASSRICHYTIRYMISMGTYYAGTVVNNLGKYNDTISKKFSGYGLANTNVDAMKYAIASKAGSASLNNIGKGLKLGGALGTVQTTRELVNEIKSSKK